ncbi:hypothetical protein F5148DRAFT_1278789 [Russula earlei]|uniref:Uncharacterized protein n=1 Tax=Russula earlei TaxID=71964 RepID=A0ACC0UP10_9AGAM|nr:hypothetical protein F5148DRAFT_1278789 [Russula earlei]
MVVWAWTQRLAADELAKKHKEEGWTRTHGFFAIMGGLEGNKPIRMLLPEQLESYSLTGDDDFPRIAEREIKDKSKGDFISKAIVILHTGWFLTQCIARGANGLPLTEFELVTAALAALNFVLCFLWWDKPQNVECGVRVYKKRSTEQRTGMGHSDENVEATTVGLGGALQTGPSDRPAGTSHEPFTNFPFLDDPFHWQPVLRFLNLTDSNEELDLGRRSAAGMLIVASAFGIIHCFGWSFAFSPSSAERIIWLVVSVIITIIPISYALLVLIARFGKSDFSDLLLDGYGLLANAYFFSRLALLMLTLLALRSLPPEAYRTVPWVSFIPHF